MRTLRRETITTYASGGSRSADLGQPDGVLTGIGIRIEGAATGATGNQDDSPERLVEHVEIDIPTKRGTYQIRGALRDFLILSWYAGLRAERTIPAGATDFDSYLTIPLGWPPELMEADHPWGIEASYIVDAIQARIVWAAATEYGAAATTVANPVVEFDLQVEDEPHADNRLCILYNRNRFPVESATVFPERAVRLPGGTTHLFGLLMRQEDTSATADRVDGLVTRYRARHANGRTLFDAYFRTHRAQGAAWCKVDRDFAVTASPEGLDGTVFWPANRSLRAQRYPAGGGASVYIEIDSNAPVPNGVTDVTPAAGDAFHVLAMGLAPGS